jgi:hypothetical protein
LVGRNLPLHDHSEHLAEEMACDAELLALLIDLRLGDRQIVGLQAAPNLRNLIDAKAAAYKLDYEVPTS